MSGNPHRILFVEDDEQLRPLIESVLQEEGYAIDSASTVAAAEELLATNNYDLMLTDGRLPDGNGFSLAEAASKMRMKVLVCTAYGSEFSVWDRASYPVVAKPVRISDLLMIIRHFLGEDDSGSTPMPRPVPPLAI